jgi:hypothetical protein
MSKLNKYRQTKEYKLSDQGGEYTVPHKGADPSEYDGDVYPEDRKEERNAYHKQHIERDYVEEAKIEIADKVLKHLDDVIFEMVCEEMGKRHIFQSQNYLTEAGMYEFEEQFFEFYHEHHGDILDQIQAKLIY